MCIIIAKNIYWFDLNDFEWDLVVGLSISVTADLLGISNTTISRLCREWFEKGNIHWSTVLCVKKVLPKDTLEKCSTSVRKY